VFHDKTGRIDFTLPYALEGRFRHTDRRSYSAGAFWSPARPCACSTPRHSRTSRLPVLLHRSKRTDVGIGYTRTQYCRVRSRRTWGSPDGANHIAAVGHTPASTSLASSVV